MTRHVIIGSGFTKRLKETDRFFASQSAVHMTMRRLVELLAKASLPYAIYGGMAVSVYGHRPTTDDVEVVLTAESLTAFRERYADSYEATRFRGGRRFLDRANEIVVDVMVAGHRPGLGHADIRYPNPAQVAEVIDGVSYMPFVCLVQLKLACGRHRDLGDVAALIRVHELDESFLPQLHPSVHSAFLECLEEKRREDDFIAREG